MTPISSLSINTNSTHIPTCYFHPKSPQPIKLHSHTYSNFGAFNQNLSNLSLWECKNTRYFHKLRIGKDVFVWGEKKLSKKRRRVGLVKCSQGFNFNGGGGGNKIDGNTARVLGNLALACGLTYLSMTGQLGWVLDTIVSLWLLSIIIPVVGIGAFLWWARQDMVQSSCPNCGNPFQVFKSTLNDELQLCPFCSQPFSVEGNEFVKEPIQFSNRSTAFGQKLDDFSPWSRKGKDAASTVVDIEADVKDAE